MGGVVVTAIGYDTGYGSVMVSLHWSNRSQMSVIVSNWSLQMTAGASIIAHVRMDMAWIIRSSGAREGWYS